MPRNQWKGAHGALQRRLALHARASGPLLLQLMSIPRPGSEEVITELPYCVVQTQVRTLCSGLLHSLLPPPPPLSLLHEPDDLISSPGQATHAAPPTHPPIPQGDASATAHVFRLNQTVTASASTCMPDTSFGTAITFMDEELQVVASSGRATSDSCGSLTDLALQAGRYYFLNVEAVASLVSGTCTLPARRRCTG